MTKIELVELLKSLNIPISECTPKDDDLEKETHLYFWDFIWEDIIASTETYTTNVTYQISFIASYPRDKKLLELKKKLNERGIFPKIEHEYIAETRRVHSFFTIDVIEELGEKENEQ